MDRQSARLSFPIISFLPKKMATTSRMITGAYQAAPFKVPVVNIVPSTRSSSNSNNKDVRATRETRKFRVIVLTNITANTTTTTTTIIDITITVVLATGEITTTKRAMC
jgi:hypothetical protein